MSRRRRRAGGLQRRHVVGPAIVAAVALDTATAALLTALVAVEVALLLVALVDLWRRPVDQVPLGTKVPWVALCLLVQIAGPIVYLVLARTQTAVPEPAERPEAPTGGAIPWSALEAAAGGGAPRYDPGTRPAGAPEGAVPAPIAPAPAGAPATAAVDGRVARAAAALFDAATGAAAFATGAPSPAFRPGAPAPTAPPPAVELEAVRKVFKEGVALDGLNLTVPEGSVFGFLGPNGAGKTTTLRILSGLARPTGGRARVLGHDVGDGDGRARAALGYLPDVPAFYKWMTATEYLRFAGRLFGLEGDALEARVAALVDLAGLRGVSTRIGGYSRGMKQRLGVAQALVNAPRLLLLDEPTSALDPIGRREVLDMIVALRGRTTVFFSTHILADVERVCDTAAIIDHGRVAAMAGIDELRRRHGGRHRLRVDVDDTPRLMGALHGAAWLRTVEPAEDGGLTVTVDEVDVAQRELPGVVARLGLALRRFESDEVSLEDVFLELVGGGRP